MDPEILKRAARVRLLLMDVDGVLTDGRLIYLPQPDGKVLETKAFDSQDGIALQWLSWHGIETGVISGRVSPATEERAHQVGMRYVYQGHIEKIPILEEIRAASGITLDEIAYMGDDQRAARGETGRPLRHSRIRRPRSSARDLRVVAESARTMGRRAEQVRNQFHFLICGHSSCSEPLSPRQ